MTAYPNPTVEFIYISGLQDQSAKFLMINSDGKQLNASAHWDIDQKQWVVDLRDLKQGIYFLQINQNGKVENLRVMIR